MARIVYGNGFDNNKPEKDMYSDKNLIKQNETVYRKPTGGEIANRDALVLYLENVRDLEILKNRIASLWEQESDRYKRDLNDYPTEVKKPTIKNEALELGSGFFTFFVLGFLSILGVLFSAARTDYNKTGWLVSHLAELGVGLFIFLILISLIGTLICLFGAISDRNEIKQENKEIEKWYQDALITARTNQSYINKRSKEWEKANAFYRRQYSKADLILNNFYAMNIIPKQFRGASGACYLYDYMSSSKESFQMALISNQIEEGIKRIEARLAYISRQLGEVLYQQRVMRDENREEINRRIEHDNHMINSLKAMENRQENIEAYSRLSANYNEAAALFSLATYLKN